MKLLVTGREGQLVRCLKEQATERPGLTVSTAGRPLVDMAVPGAIAEAIESEQPDLVINAAAYTAVDQAEDELDLAFRVNAHAAGEAARAAHSIGAPFIQISTDYVFDGSARSPIDEEQLVAPLGVYGRSKLVGEEQVRAAAPDHVILRTAWLISPFGRNFVRSMLRAATQGSVLTVVDDQRGSPTSALDLADAILHLADQLQQRRAGLTGRTFHLAGLGEASWCELAAAVMDEARVHGLPATEVRPIRTEDWLTRAVRPAYSVLDSRRFAVATGFVMPDWRNSLRVIIARLARQDR